LPQPTVSPVVLDTNLASAIVAKRANYIAPYRRHLTGRPIVLAFVTVAELRYGAFQMGWQENRLDEMEKFISRTTVVMPDNDLVTTCARLRTDCRASGHGLHQKIHEADRWIAATCLRYNLPVVTNDRIFVGVPGLVAIVENGSG
jgi:predicted nucleic acid-binding protein